MSYFYSKAYCVAFVLQIISYSPFQKLQKTIRNYQKV